MEFEKYGGLCILVYNCQNTPFNALKNYYWKYMIDPFTVTSNLFAGKFRPTLCSNHMNARNKYQNITITTTVRMANNVNLFKEYLFVENDTFWCLALCTVIWTGILSILILWNLAIAWL